MNLNSQDAARQIHQPSRGNNTSLSPESGLSTLTPLSQPVAPATRCARAWKEGGNTMKPHLCAWVLCGGPWVGPPHRLPGPCLRSRRPRTTVRGPSRAGRPATGRWCPTPLNTEGNPAKVPLTPPHRLCRRHSHRPSPNSAEHVSSGTPQ